jgi:trehalose utilization protein/lysophospholipase L1-like esterase
MKTILAFLALAASSWAADPIRVLVWDEQQPKQSEGYGDKFLGETIAAHLTTQPGLSVKSTKLSAPDQGLDDATLDTTDVLVFWSHVRQKDQDDARVEAVVKRVMEGRLGLIALHSAHWSKPFVRLMQERAKADAAKEVPGVKWEYTNDQPYGVIRPKVARITPYIEKGGNGVWKLTLPQCVFPAYRADGAPGHLTTLLRDHPIAKGLPERWDIPQTEMYGEPFHVPPPDEVVFEERWDKGEHFRSGCVWQVGKGRVFYFRPGHETYPVFKQAEPLKVIENAARWLAPVSASPPKDEPTNAAEAAARKAKADAALEERYQALFAKLPPEQQAWERVLQNQLGSFYLPIHKQEKVAGRSNAWDFVQDDPKLPRILLIGDSVSRGYTQAVRKAMAGKANVHRAPANCGPTASGLKNIEVWLGEGAWDVIHFNFGIHDRATPVADYKSRLEQLIDRMKKTGARLMWASTTPCPDTPDGKSKSAPIIERNTAAAEVMQKHGIVIDDLFSAITPHLATMQNPNDVHFNGPGYDFLGQTVARVIEAVLK